jgi:hypothetical protein
MGLTTVLWVAVALLTKPDPDELLRKFYLRAHPLGCWTPYRSLDKHGPAGSFKLVFRGIFIAILGTVSVSLLMLGLTHAWFARYLTGTLTVAAAIITFLIFWKQAKQYLAVLALRAADNAVPAAVEEETIINNLN